MTTVYTKIERDTHLTKNIMVLDGQFDCELGDYELDELLTKDEIFGSVDAEKLKAIVDDCDTRKIHSYASTDGKNWVWISSDF